MSASPHVVEVGEADFQAAVLDASNRSPVVVDFWASWCRPCLVLGPILERLADEYEGRFTLAKVDVDANPGLASAYGIQGIPAVKAFGGGAVVGEFVGAQPEEAVRAFIDRLVPSPADALAAEARAAASPEAAESSYRKAMAIDPRNAEAGAGLAAILVDRGELDEAREVLAGVPAEGEVPRVMARLDLLDEAEGRGDLALAARAALDGDPEGALERCLAAVGGDGERRDAARDTMLRIFEVLGEDHPLVRAYRPRLASALF